MSCLNTFGNYTPLMSSIDNRIKLLEPILEDRKDLLPSPVGVFVREFGRYTGVIYIAPTERGTRCSFWEQIDGTGYILFRPIRHVVNVPSPSDFRKHSESLHQSSCPFPPRLWKESMLVKGSNLLCVDPVATVRSPFALRRFSGS